MSDYSESIQFVPEGGGGGPSVHSSPRHYEDEEDSDSIAFLPEGNTSSLQQHGRVGSGFLKPTRASSFASMESIAFIPMTDASPNSTRSGAVGRHSSGLPPLTPGREVVKVLTASLNDEPRPSNLGMSFGGSSVASSIQFIPVPQTKNNNGNNSGMAIPASSPESPNLLLPASGRSSLNVSAAPGDLSNGAPSPVKKTVVGNMLKSRGQGMAKALEKDMKKVVSAEEKKGVKNASKVTNPLSATVPLSKRQSPLVAVSKGPSFGDANAEDDVGMPLSPIRRGNGAKMATSNNSEFGVAAGLASTVPMIRIGGGAPSDDDVDTPKVPPRRRPKKFVVDDVASGDGDAVERGAAKPKSAAEDYMETLRQFAVDSASDDEHLSLIDSGEEGGGYNNATSVVDDALPHQHSNRNHQGDEDDVAGGFEQLIRREKSRLRDQGLLDGSNDDNVAKENINRRKTPPTRIASPKPLPKSSNREALPAADGAPPTPIRRSAPKATGGSPPRSQQQHGIISTKKKASDSGDGEVPEGSNNRLVKTRLVLDHLDDQVRNNDQYTATFGDGSTGGTSNDEGESPRDGHSLDPTPPRGASATGVSNTAVAAPRSRDVESAPQPTGQVSKHPSQRPHISSKHVVISPNLPAPTSKRSHSAAAAANRPKSATKISGAIKELCALQAQETNDVAAFNAKQQAELEDLCRRIYRTQCEDDYYAADGDRDPEDAPRLYERMLPSNQHPPPHAIQLSPRSKALRRSTSAVQHSGGGNVSPPSRPYHHNNNGHGAWDGYGIKRPALYTHLLPHTESSMASRVPAAAALGPHFGQFADTAKPGDVRPAALANGVPMWDYIYPPEGTAPPQKRSVSLSTKRTNSGHPVVPSTPRRKVHQPPTHIVSHQSTHRYYPMHAHNNSAVAVPPSHTVVIPPPTTGMSRVHIISPNGSQIFQSTTKNGRYSHDEKNTFNVHFEEDSKTRHRDPLSSATGGGGVVHVVGGSSRTSRTPSAAGGDVDSSGRLLEGGFSAAAIRVASKVLGVTVWSAEEQREEIDHGAQQRNSQDDGAQSTSTESDLQLAPMFFFSAGGARLSDRQQTVFLDQLVAIQKALEKQERSLRDARTKDGATKKSRPDGKTSISVQSEMEVSKLINDILEKQRSEMIRGGRYGGGATSLSPNAEDSPAAAALHSQRYWGLQRLPTDTQQEAPSSRSARGAIVAQSLVDGDRRSGATPQSLRDFTQNGPAAWSHQEGRQIVGAASRTSSATSASRNKPANRTAALRKVFNVLLQSAVGEDLRIPSATRTATKSITRDQLRSLRPYLLVEADGAAQEHRLQQPSPSAADVAAQGTATTTTTASTASKRVFAGAQPLSIHSPSTPGVAPTTTSRSQRSASTTLSDRIGVVTGPPSPRGGGVSPVLPIRPSIGHATASPYVHLGIPTLPVFQCLCEFTASVLIPILLQPTHRCYHAFDFATFSRVLLDSPELARTSQGEKMRRVTKDGNASPSDNGYESYFEALQ